MRRFHGSQVIRQVMGWLCCSLLCFSLVFTGGLSLLLSGCADNSKAKEPVMTINDTITVTRGEYDTLYNDFVKKMGFGGKDREKALDNKMIQEQLKQMTLNKLIFMALLKDDAQKHQITVSDEEVQQFKAEHLKEASGQQGLEKVLKEEGMSMADFDKNLKDELLIKKFIESRMGNALKVADEEARQFYKDYEKQFSLMDRIHAAHILVKAIEPNIKQELRKANPKITQKELSEGTEKIRGEKRQQAQKILDHVLQHPDDFAKTAREKSEDHASGVFGGDLNFLYENATAPSFWKAAKETKPGTIHPQVVETVFGFHVIRVDAFEPAHKQSFEEAKPQIVNAILQQRKQRELLTWVNGKRKDAKIVFTEEFKPEGYEQGYELKKNPIKPENIGLNPDQTAPQKPAATVTGAKPGTPQQAQPQPQGQQGHRG